MATYSMNHPEKGEISYTDKKRYLWFMSITFPLMPLMTIYWFTQTGIEALLAIPLGINYLLLPALDWAIGSDSSNPPEELVPQLEEDRYYRILTYLTVPMHFIVLLAFLKIQVIKLSLFKKKLIHKYIYFSFIYSLINCSISLISLYIILN